MSVTSLSVRTDSPAEFIEISDRVRRVVSDSGVHDGICLVFVPHTTAGVTINEAADPSVRKDILKELNKIIPFDDAYQHAEGNSAAHIKAMVAGSSVTIPVENGKLLLGTWQGIYFCEFDGPRQRTVQVQILG